MSQPSVTVANDTNFDAHVLEAEEPVLVDFTASWCGPCKILAPVIDKLAEQSGGQYRVVKVDVDDAPETARRYGIRGVPTVVAFHGGVRIGQQVGVAPAATLLALLPKSA